MKMSKTQRGFAFVTPCIWLNEDSTGPQIQGPGGKTNEYVNVRMHLDQKQAEKLLPHLIKFIETGDI